MWEGRRSNCHHIFNKEGEAFRFARLEAQSEAFRRRHANTLARSAPGLKFPPILPIDVSMPQNCSGKVTLGDLRPQGLLDLYRQGTTWVAAIRLGDGRVTNLPLEESVTTRKAALQFLKIELNKPALSRIPS